MSIVSLEFISLLLQMWSTTTDVAMKTFHFALQELSNLAMCTDSAD